MDETGNITIVGEGEAAITATFAGVSTTVTVTGVPGEGGGATPPETGGEEAPPEDGREEAPSESEQAEPPEQATAPVDVPEPVEPAGTIQMVRPEVLTDTDKGGVQNWRVFEMSETAQELGNIEAVNPLLGFTGAAAGALFLAGGLAYTISFSINIGRKRHVHNK